MLLKIRQLFQTPVFEDEEDTRAAALLHTILLLLAGASFIVPLILNFVAILNPDDEIPFAFNTFLMGLIVPLLMLGLHLVMKRGRVRLAGAIMAGTLFLLTTSTIVAFRGIRDTATGMYILVIAMAGLLLGGQAALIFTILTVVVTLGIYYAEANGILNITLSETPEIVEWFIFAVVVILIGALLRFAFNSLNHALQRAREANQQLESIQQSLAERVAARTRDLELAAEIGRQISRVREPERMLSEAVELIRARFDLYYTQIYLVDRVRHNLVLRAGTGTVGEQLLQRGHRLPLSGTSINGTAAVNNETLIIADTVNNPLFRLNPLLPETRSEMAVPLVISTDVVGVLNLQSNRPQALTEENLPAFEALAGQLAVAIDNARLFSEVTDARSAVEAQAQHLTRTGWESFLNALDRQEHMAYTFDLNRANFTDTPVQTDNDLAISVPINVAGESLGEINISGNEWYTWQEYDEELVGAVAERVAQQIENLRLLAETERYRNEAEEATRRLTREGWDSYLEKQEQQPEGYIYDQQQVLPLSDLADGNGFKAGLVQALTVRGESIGQFEMATVSDMEDDISDLVEAVADRLSAHIENLRLAAQTESALTETEKRAEELSVINELARTVSQQLDLEQILETVYEQVRRVMSADAFIIGLYEPETNLIQYPLVYDEGQRYQENMTFLSKETTIYQVLQSGEPYMLLYSPENELPGGETLARNALGNESKPSRSMMFVPLLFSRVALGVISVQSYQYNAYNEDDLTLIEGIASHLAVAIQNAQLFEQTQLALAQTEEQAARLVMLTELGQALTQAVTVEEVYRVTAERAHKIVSSDRTSITLLNEDGSHFDILALGGDAGTTKVGERQPLEGSSVGVAVQEKRLVVVNKSEDSGISGIFSFMIAPLISSGQVIGTLNVGNKTPNAYGAREERLLLQTATLLATTIESRRLLAQTQQRADELSVINRIARAISQTFEIEQLLNTILDEISRILQVDAFIVGLYDAETNLLDYPLIYDDGERYQVSEDAPLTSSVVYQVLHSNEPRFILRTPEDVAARTRNTADSMLGDHSKISASLIYVPLILGGRTIGFTSIQSYQHDAYEPGDLTLLEGIASHVAVALENARLFEETEQRAEELSVINQVAQVVAQQLELRELYSAVHEQVQRAIISDAFYIAIYNKEEDTINFPYLYDDGELYELEPIPANPELEVVEVITTGEPILVNFTPAQYEEQLAQGQDLLASLKAPTAMIFVPLLSGLKPIGAISIQNYQSHNYTQADVDLLSGIAYHLAVALENARLFSETQQRAEELAVINQIAQAVSGHIEQEELLATVYEQVRRIMPVDAFYATTYDPATELIQYLLVMDEGTRFSQEPSPLGKGAISRVITEGQPILINRTPEEVAEITQKQEVLLIGNVQRVSASLLYVPLLIGTEPIGGLSVQSYEFNAYSQSEVELLLGVANHVAVTLENARLFEQTQETLAETELLYKLGAQINQAVTLQDLVNVVSPAGIAPGARSAGLFRFETGEDGQAEWMELAANWSEKGTTVLPIGSRIHLPDLSLAAAELYTPNEPLLISNVMEDDRVDQVTRSTLQQVNTAAMAIIPMQQQERWIGALIIRWDAPYPFGSREKRLYNSLSRQMSTALSNQLLLAETQQRAAELEQLNRIETALSQADDEAGILEALASLAGENQAVTLHYTAEDEQPVRAYTVAYWEKGEIQAEDKLLYAPFNIQEHAGLNLGLKQPDKVVFVTDVKHDKRLDKKAVQEAEKIGYRAVIIIPLRSAGRWQGFVSVKWPNIHSFTTREISVWEQIREPVAAVVASRRAYLAQQEALSETAILYEAGARLSIARSYDEVLAVVREHTVLGQDVSNVSLMLFDRSWYEGARPEWADVLSFWSPVVQDQKKSRFFFKDYPSAERIFDEPSKPVIFEDVPNSPDVDDNLKRMLVKGFNTQTFAFFPMMVRGEWIGYANAMYPQPMKHSEADIRRTQAVVQQAAVAVQGLRNLEQAEQQATEAQQRSNELASLNRVMTTVVSSFDLAEMLNMVADELIDLFNLQHVGIGLMSDDRSELTIIADKSSNPDDESALGLVLPLAGNKLSQQVIETRRPVVIQDAQTNPLTEPVHEVMRWRGTEVLIILPLISGRETIGTIGLDIGEKERIFNDADLQLAETIVAQLATAVQNVRLFEQTEARAQELSVLNEMSQDLTAKQTVDSILNGFHRYISNLMEATDAYIALYDEVQNEMVYRMFGEGEGFPAHRRRPIRNGLTDYVLRTQQPLLISSDVTAAVKALGCDAIGRSAESWVGSPLMSGSKAIGVVAVQSFTKPGLYTERHRDLLMAVANQIAIAVESARLFEQAQARAAELAILNEMGRSLTALVDTDAILDNVYRYTSRLMETTNFYVAFFNQKHNEITFALDIRGERVMRNVGTRKAGQGLTEYIIHTREPLLIPENIDARLEEIGIEKIGPQAQSWLGVPMMVGNQVIGVLALQTFDKPRTYNQQHLNLLTSVASQAAIAIENARLFEQIQARARRERILREVTAKVRGAADADTIMRTAVQEIGRALGRQTFVYLSDTHLNVAENAEEEVYGD